MLMHLLDPYVEALRPSVVVFGDGALEGWVVNTRRGSVGQGLCHEISVLSRGRKFHTSLCPWVFLANQQSKTDSYLVRKGNLEDQWPFGLSVCLFWLANGNVLKVISSVYTSQVDQHSDMLLRHLCSRGSGGLDCGLCLRFFKLDSLCFVF